MGLVGANDGPATSRRARRARAFASCDEPDMAESVLLRSELNVPASTRVVERRPQNGKAAQGSRSTETYTRRSAFGYFPADLGHCAGCPGRAWSAPRRTPVSLSPHRGRTHTAGATFARMERSCSSFGFKSCVASQAELRCSQSSCTNQLTTELWISWDAAFVCASRPHQCRARVLVSSYHLRYTRPCVPEVLAVLLPRRQLGVAACVQPHADRACWPHNASTLKKPRRRNVTCVPVEQERMQRTRGREPGALCTAVLQCTAVASCIMRSHQRLFAPWRHLHVRVLIRGGAASTLQE